jgi:hypothetical protein
MVLSQTRGAVTDEHLVRVLRVFVHATRPVLHALREADPLGLRRRALATVAADGTPLRHVDDVGTASPAIATARERVLGWISAREVPGTPAWAAMDPDQRSRWWLNRVGRFTALVAALPGVGGALADRLPVQDALGAAGQGLVLCAIAGEHGMVDDDSQIRLLASVLFKRDVDDAIARLRARPVDQAEADRHSAELSAELTAELAESKRRHGRFTLPAIAGTLWRMGRLLWGLGDELGRRPQGRWYHRMLGMLPIVGAAGDYLGERSALRRVVKSSRRRIGTPQAARM